MSTYDAIRADVDRATPGFGNAELKSALSLLVRKVAELESRLAALEGKER
jgi:hypothetical protein